MDCTCKHVGHGDNPSCPICHPKKPHNGQGKPTEVRTHVSDRRLPQELKSVAGSGLRTGQVLARFEPTKDPPIAD